VRACVRVCVCVCVCGCGSEGGINFYVGTTNAISSAFVRYVIDYARSIFGYSTIIFLCLFQLPLHRWKDGDKTEASHIAFGIGDTIKFHAKHLKSKACIREYIPLFFHPTIKKRL
jgi:hypothetical protein